jgi:pyruvate dehydrogenase E1 component alpha subunit
MGRTSGASKGIGGSMHMYSREGRMYGGCGIVGAQIPLGTGAAFAHRYRGEDAVNVCMYGDGAANQGQVHEAKNMAAVWELPTIFVCENNRYGMGTSTGRASSMPDFFRRSPFLPGMRVDGMDVLAVKQAMTWARARALEHGPLVLEMDTYRYHGHSMSDPGSTYRTRDEVSSTRQERDPIDRVKQLLLREGLADATELKAVEREVKKEIDAAIAEARSAPFPSPEEYMAKFVFASPPADHDEARGVGVDTRWKMSTNPRQP